MEIAPSLEADLVFDEDMLGACATGAVPVGTRCFRLNLLHAGLWSELCALQCHGNSVVAWVLAKHVRFEHDHI